MVDILSQEEVDALLTAVGDGELPVDEDTGEETTGKIVSRYDFRRPDIVSKDQMRTLQMLHKTFCRYLSTTLSTYLRTVIEVNLVAVDQLTYGEFNMSLSNPTYISIFSLEPLEGRGVLEINPVLVFSLIDRLLGGAGYPPTEVRVLTDIEQSIIDRVIKIFIEGLNQAWKHVADFNFRVTDSEVNPQFVQVVAPGETVILVTLEMKAGESSGIISLCFPFIFIEPIMSRLSAQHLMAATKKRTEENKSDSIKKNLEKSQLLVSCKLGEKPLTIREILELKKGDVIVLDSKVTSRLIVEIQGKEKFLGIPGIIGKKKAVRIMEVLKD
ncbi:MAG: flagellar motor switch protein FliM [Candidatus Aureabacteria bacterium]|nr:flagellar motor switch protein FliM [Candidatus Auribacterota bacterium]